MQPLLDRVLELPPRRRRAWLKEACAGDPQLRADIEAILAADEQAGGLLDAPTGGFIEWFVEEARQQSTLTSPRQPPDALDVGLIARQVLTRHSRARAAGRTPYSDPPVGTAGATARFLPGAMLASRYRVVALLGRGGMGEVYRADDLKLGQGVALKFLPASVENDPAHLERLLNEVRLARQVSHPNVCRVYDVGETQGRHFISMEYVDGEDLSSLLKRIGRLPNEKALHIAQQLCAGLAAAHEQGILHRDLKPANVMLDGRGRVRIADFGLAAAGVVEGRIAREGTKAYMAPEQLAGLEATRRSDLYALGLVLYEVFTGRRAFPADSEQELRRLQEESSPARPSSLVEGIGAEVERTILSCLEKDPALRPVSAVAVAAMMPGGDPLAAALAAGETPSPEMVAHAGPKGALTPRAAYALLAVVVALQIVAVTLADRASVLGWMPGIKSADVLESDARAILKRLGHDAVPVDSARGIYPSDFYFSYITYIRERDTSPERWKALRQPGEASVEFDYRQRPRLLIPTGSTGNVLAHIEPPMEEGDEAVTTDLRGRLLFLHVEPPRGERPVEDSTPSDWSALFQLAGLDMQRFQPVKPTINPPVFADDRAAWSGTLPDFGDLPVRIEAAALRGKPVYFEMVAPWHRYWEVANKGPVEDGSFLLYNVAASVLLACVAAAALGLAVWNWRRGRADRRGAVRIAGVVLCLRFAWWVLGGHHVPAAWEEAQLLLGAATGALLAAGITWLLYVGLEPHVRRLHPTFMIAWARLLAGRVRDPLVGRDVLIGLAVGSIASIVSRQLNVVVPHLLALSAPPPPCFYPNVPWVGQPWTQTMLGGRHLLAAVPVIASESLSATFVLMMFLLGLRLVLRKDWIAIPVFVAVFTLFTPWSFMAGYTPVPLLCAFLGAIAWTWAIYRLGFVASLAAAAGTFGHFPITGNVSAPHFGTGLAGVLFIVVLAVSAALTARVLHLPASRAAVRMGT